MSEFVEPLGMRVLVRNMRARMQALQRLSAFSAASLSGIDVIKSYEMPPWALGRFGLQRIEGWEVWELHYLLV